MKRKDKIFVWSVVGVMLFSAMAISLLVIFSPSVNDETDVVINDNAQKFVCETPEELVDAVAHAQGTWPPSPLENPLTEATFEDVVVGTGQEVVAEDECLVFHYRLANGDGTAIEGQDTFLTSAPFTSPLNGLIEGWQQTLPGMKVGGLRRLMIPSSLAYNDGLDLIFDIELVEIVQE